MPIPSASETLKTKEQLKKQESRSQDSAVNTVRGANNSRLHSFTLKFWTQVCYKSDSTAKPGESHHSEETGKAACTAAGVVDEHDF